MVRVVLADDEAVIRAGVRAILAADPEIEVVAEAADGRAAVEQVRLHRPDVAVLDIRMPLLDGLAAAEELHGSGTAVLIMTTFDEDAYVSRALHGGASGFLLKTGDPRELVLGVRAAAEGGAYLSPPVARRVIRDLGGPRMSRELDARRRIDVLSDREREVLALVGAGLSNAEIADRLHVVEGTVKAYVSAILSRLDLRNRVQAAVLAYEAGIVSER
ncbi:response regulator transcription factor [Saccharopolyspora taberi]|uniref:Response regulator transcription factor n=1 Tax=Saccharopolyspora taberi TaxID=60895 RepID=A0ABN3VM77_9PSEU